MDGGHRPRTGERLSKLAVAETSGEVQEGRVVGGKRFAGRSQEHDAPTILLRAQHHGGAKRRARLPAPSERQCQSGASPGSRWNQRDTYCLPDSTTVSSTVRSQAVRQAGNPTRERRACAARIHDQVGQKIASPEPCVSAGYERQSLAHPVGSPSSPRTFWSSRTCTLGSRARPRRSTSSSRAREQAYVVMPEAVRGSQPAGKRIAASADASKGIAPRATTSSLQPGINSSNAAAPAAIRR